MHSEDSESVSVVLDRYLLEAIDDVSKEWGIHSRADIIERILREVLTPDLDSVQTSG